MKADNPLSREFLVHYPIEAARVLENVSAEHVSAFFMELPVKVITPVLGCMLPEVASDCLEHMQAKMAATILSGLPAITAARIYRLMAPDKKNEITAHLTDKTLNQIRRYLKYPLQSIGALLNQDIDMLPENITVSEAIRYIERLDHPINCDLYIINDAHCLVGMLGLGTLLGSNHNARLRDIMNRKIQVVSAHADTATVVSHPGWVSLRRLPVVERDNTLVGALDFSDLNDSISENGAIKARDPLENLLSLTGLYWLSSAQLLDSLLSIKKEDSGGPS